jgi:hypothetical protein
VRSRTRVGADRDQSTEQAAEALVDAGEQAAVDRRAGEAGDERLGHGLDVHRPVQRRPAEGLGERDPAVAGDDQGVQPLEAGRAPGRPVEECRLEAPAGVVGGREGWSPRQEHGSR